MGFLHWVLVTDLDLHPTAQVVAQEVGRHRVQHVHLVRLERHRLLVKIVPEWELSVADVIVRLRATDRQQLPIRP